MIRYFESVDSERGIALRCACSFSLRDFPRLSNREKAPDHFWLSHTASQAPRDEAAEALYALIFRFPNRRGVGFRPDRRRRLANSPQSSSPTRRRTEKLGLSLTGC